MIRKKVQFFGNLPLCFGSSPNLIDQNFFTLDCVQLALSVRKVSFNFDK